MSEQLTIGFAHFFAYKTSLKADSVGGRGSGALPFSDLFFSWLLFSPHLSSFSATKKDITPEISNKQFFFFGVGCFLFSKKGRKRALACVAHQINKFYVRTACFFGGVIFCGTLLR